MNKTLNPNCSEWVSRVSFDTKTLTDEEMDCLDAFLDELIGSEYRMTTFNISKKSFDYNYEDFEKLPFWDKLKDNYSYDRELV